jgi:hypothetical protein
VRRRDGGGTGEVQGQDHSPHLNTICDNELNFRHNEFTVRRGCQTSIELALNDILRGLDAIEEKMQPLQPLQDQVVVLKATVQEHVAQHQTLDATVAKVADAQSAKSAARPPNPNRPRQGDDAKGP